MADEKIIFSMNGVGKVLPHNNKVILKDIYLSFFYGAKIGIIGLNGSGKSTLLKIIAGVRNPSRVRSCGPLDTPSGISHRNRRWIRTRLSSKWSRRACRK